MELLDKLYYTIEYDDERGDYVVIVDSNGHTGRVPFTFAELLDSRLAREGGDLYMVLAYGEVRDYTLQADIATRTLDTWQRAVSWAVRGGCNDDVLDAHGLSTDDENAYLKAYLIEQGGDNAE